MNAAGLYPVSVRTPLSPGGPGAKNPTILIFAPTGRDAQLTANFLGEFDKVVLVCRDMGELCSRLDDKIDLVILAEETLNSNSVQLLVEKLSCQPPWSDIPISIITSGGEASEERLRILDSIGPRGNIGLLERPFRRGTLLSTVDVAIRSRRRQYQVRNLLNEVRSNEERFRSMVDNIAQLAWMTDAAGDIVWLNRRWFDYTGSEEAAMLGRGWLTLCHPDHAPRIADEFQLCILAGREWEDTFPLRAHDGSYHWFLSQAFPIRDHKGRILRWFGTNTDITERKQAQAVLENLIQERTAELTEANDQLETLVYSIAHDLRAPLRSMQAFAKILLMDYAPKLDPTAEDYARRIVRSAERMDVLVLDLLAYGRAVRAGITLEPVQLETVWQMARSQFEQQIAEKHAIITTDLPLPSVCANAAILSQVLANLLGNALKFVPPGTVPAIRFSAIEENDLVRITLQDNGIGVSPEYHEKIFRVFERLDNAHRDGTGIGLAIVRKGIERMGGRVGIISAPPQVGSTFWIELPGVPKDS
jgi:PAS domain S-box-containing protein